MIIFESTHIKGQGRGQKEVYPTINLVPPLGLKIQEGIYASFIRFDEKTYWGALHFGPRPTYKETFNTVEVYLIDTDKPVPLHIHGTIIVTLVKRIREIKSFENVLLLKKQIEEDIKKIRNILKNKEKNLHLK